MKSSVQLDAWWRMMPQNSKMMAFALMRECTVEESRRCFDKTNAEVEMK